MTVAGGLIDLSQQAPSQGLGDLKVVANDPGRGLATLSFTGYQAERRHRYLISALPVSLLAVTEPGKLPVVNLVEFNNQGFVLQMGQPHQSAFVLGHCMIQVGEITTDTIIPPELTLEQAIHRYFRLIQQEEYAAAWPMLSTTFRQSLNLTFDRYVAEWDKKKGRVRQSWLACDNVSLPRRVRPMSST